MKKLPLIIGLAGFLSFTSAHAQLAHRYSFDDGTGNDSVGTANGTLVGSGNTISGGMLTTNGSGSLSLPASVGTGITGNFSVEMFVTIPTNPGNFSSLFSLSSPGNRNFFLLNPSRPNAGGAFTGAFQQQPVYSGMNAPNNTNQEVDISGGTFGFGTEQDVVVTYSTLNNTITLYLNGTSVASGSITAALNGTNTFNLQTLVSGGQSGINGNGPFPDPGINGSTNDYRIFSNTLTAAQVTALHNLGNDPTNAAIGLVAGGVVPEPSAWVAMVAGVAALVGVQRFRRRQA